MSRSCAYVSENSAKHECVKFCGISKRKECTYDIRKTCKFEIQVESEATSIYKSYSFVLIVAIAILIPSGLLGYGEYKLGRYYQDYLWDRITLAVVLISIAVVVNFADAITVLLPINSAVLLIGIQMLHAAVKKTIEVVSESRKIMRW